MAADGSIIIETEIDDKKAQQELNRLNRKIQTLNDQIYVKQKQKMPLIEQAQELGAQLDQAKAKLDEMQSGGSFYTSASIKEQSNVVNQLQKEWDGINNRIDRMDAGIQEATVKLNLAQTQAGEMQRQMASTGPASEKMAQAMEKMQKSANRFSRRLQEVIRSALIFTVISRSLSSLRDWFGRVIKSNEEATAAIARLKGALLTMVQPLVNVIIPAFTDFVNILSQIVAAIARFISILFGTTVEESADAAEGLQQETDALEGVGGAAKQAAKDLAGFDEINKLTGQNAGSSGGGSSFDTIAPDFSWIQDGLLSNLTFTLEDIFFDWQDLTVEDILAKLLVGLTTIAGAVLGFTLGGPGGALIGIVAGAGLGLLCSNLMLDGDGQMSQEEILSMVVTALAVIAGGVLGFVIGGPGGAALGVLLGAGLSLAVSRFIFNGDGQMSQSEIISLLIVALGAIVGGVLGFAIGGPGGAALGIIVGTGLSLSIVSSIFENDGGINKDALLNVLMKVLNVAALGAIGFFVGGPAGAVLGASVGIGLNLLIENFNWFDRSSEKIAETARQYYVPKFEGVGEDCADGISDGMNNKAGIVSKDFSNILSQKTKENLGIHSPSTVFMEIGQFLMDGLLLGIQNKVQPILDAFTMLWTNCYNIAHTNITAIIIDINNLIDRLAAIERNITITITTVYRTVGSPSSGSGTTTSRTSSSRAVSMQSIPALAQGAVIPPNREFLAVLGDQKQGTNIEAPLSTIEQAVANVMNRIGYGGEQTVNLYVDKEQLGKVVYKLNKAETRRIGVNLAGV